MDTAMPRGGKQAKKREHFSHISDLIGHKSVQKLEDITHHRVTNRLIHCMNVSYYSYLLCKRLRLDAGAGARGGLLHDLFYEENSGKQKKNNWRLHGYTALENAREFFDIGDTEADIIKCHMFPLSPDRPRYKESLVVMVIDKYCAILERVLFWR